MGKDEIGAHLPQDSRTTPREEGLTARIAGKTWLLSGIGGFLDQIIRSTCNA
jgi:hypothetical protein